MYAQHVDNVVAGSTFGRVFRLKDSGHVSVVLDHQMLS